MKAKTRKRLIIIALTVAAFIGSLAIFSSLWYSSVYGNLGFDAILYTLTSGFGGVESKLVLGWVTRGLAPSLAITLGMFLFLMLFVFKRRKKGQKILCCALSLVMSVSLFVMASFDSGLSNWLACKIQKTDIYEKEYIAPQSVNITFPEQKKNLIYIYLESMETSYFSEKEGGGEKTNVIPELYMLSQKNTNFSQNSSVGGGRDITGAKWTIGAMIAQTSGIPLTRGGDIVNHPKGFLSGAKNITDILSENGYYQAFMVGSDSSYGGRKELYETHKVDKIYDIYTAYEDNIVPDGYWQWWGMEDKHLFEYAKSELLKISQRNEPFSFTMLTADTHHVNGFLCSECDNKYSSQYSNVLSCSSNQVYEFINWIKEQDFYENTAIVISGDHCTMDHQYILKNINKKYERRLYNCFINPSQTAEHSKNREFLSFDMFPTTLAAIGAEIEGERLGFGTNLFSDEKTLCEKYGYKKLKNELNKTSDFYDGNFVD